ncbi:hypothetical protein HP15_3630 [Marinobacter adhaerens HP15]|uniref:Uncharacterized protein n=1 Tax=Marinobacter adhaerens (strain DSM 23420 / HP15) TaxID=225937 RepID=E4PGT5_MARAH|nr:hypothetical protein HP15_3630 [Marinobacter adhaerens HP15]
MLRITNSRPRYIAIRLFYFPDHQLNSLSSPEKPRTNI